MKERSLSSYCTRLPPKITLGAKRLGSLSRSSMATVPQKIGRADLLHLLAEDGVDLHPFPLDVACFGLKPDRFEDDLVGHRNR
jgi:hypothetical protein